uniref:Major facilitator superfamily (MFS) profile domain-containing protein n=1 Tax=Panagrolaimus superbus TaxID=310955 RepID=A0A914Z384_9BILA
MSLKLLFVAIIICGGGAFHYGFQLAITNPAQEAFIDFEKNSILKHFSKNLNTNFSKDIWSVIVALYSVGAICGSLSINFLTTKYGHKNSLIKIFIINFLSLLSTILAYFISSIELYSISRIILGFSNVISLAIGPLYLAEISPPNVRGRIGMSSGIAVQLGLVSGSFIAMPSIAGTNEGWWKMYLGEAGLLLTALIILIRFLPESPEILSSFGKNKNAIKSIIFFHDCSEIKAIETLEKMKEVGNISITSKMGLIQILKNVETRKKTLISVIAMFAAIFSGISVIDSFAVEILQSAGLSHSTASYANVGLSMASFLASLLSSIAVDRMGRRPLLLWCLMGQLICNGAIGVLLFLHQSFQSSNFISFTLILFISFFMILFALGPGPVCYFITAELNDISSRSGAQAWTLFTQMTRLPLSLIDDDKRC